jgi:hypothetical protein
MPWTAPDPFRRRRRRDDKPLRRSKITDEDRYYLTVLRYRDGATIEAIHRLTGRSHTTIRAGIREFLASDHEAAEAFRLIAAKADPLDVLDPVT